MGPSGPVSAKPPSSDSLKTGGGKVSVVTPLLSESLSSRFDIFTLQTTPGERSRPQSTGGNRCGKRPGPASHPTDAGPSKQSPHRGKRCHCRRGPSKCHFVSTSRSAQLHSQTTQGPIDFHSWAGNGWAVLFSHPKDFTPVVHHRTGLHGRIEAGNRQRNAKIIGLSVDPVDNHTRWAKDIEETQGRCINYPMIGDTELKVAMAYDMLPEGPALARGRTAADNATVRSVFVIGPDKKVKAMLTYPMTTGRNFDEVLRLLDLCQLTAKHSSDAGELAARRRCDDFRGCVE